jgi:hypothetical protein
MVNLSKTCNKLSIPLLVLLAISFSALPAQAKYGGGTGEPNDPYLIYDANQMNAIGADSNDWDKHFILMADIDLSGFTGTSFNVIGTGWDNAFTGVFDGNGHTISNYSSNTGLFGYVTGEIKEVGLISPDVDAGSGDKVGSLVGSNSGTITNCYAEGGSVSGDHGVGGLVGVNVLGGTPPGQPVRNGTISNCYSTGTALGDWDVGGLVGRNWEGTISNCYATGSVIGTTNVGGLVGKNSYGTISNCYASGSVSGNSDVGGLVGTNGCYDPGGLHPGRIFNCYSTGSVTGMTNVGGLVGERVSGTVSDSFWDTQTSGQSSSDGGTGKTTAEMQIASTFIGWGCGAVWTIDEGVDYPRLWWENRTGQLITNPSYWEGSGTETDPYLIYTAEQLNTIGLVVCDWDKHFKLMADIDLSGFTGTDFNIIGSYDNPFNGVFDGNGHTISNFSYTSTDRNNIGLFRYVEGENAAIKDLGLIDPDIDAGTGRYEGQFVGSLVGTLRDGTVTGCYAEGGSVSGNYQVGGLAGRNSGTIINCYSTGDISGNERVGGLVGWNYNLGTITDCYSTGSVSGGSRVGGLVGYNSYGTITDCYSTGSASGKGYVGGLVGRNWGTVTASFWDIETSGQATSDGGTGLPTAEMQMTSTFIDAGWDFNTPVWTIDEGVDYPRLWWELAPVLHAEPEVTLWTTNIITWDPVPGANDYYAECAEDANFTSILSNTGWITETSCEFTDLELGQRYWYSVKARNSAGTETCWSNVESSLQVTLADAVEVMLDPDTLKNKNMKNALLNKINAVQQMLDAGRYEEALNKLENDILAKMNGCGETGEPDKNDWIITCEGQSVLYPLIIETIENVKGLMQ